MGTTNLGGPLRIGGATGAGKGNARGLFGGVTSPIFVYGPITPTTASTVTVVSSGSKASSGAISLNGSLVSSGVATLDVPRNIQIISASAVDSTITSTVTGTDTYGVTVVETIAYNGTNAVQGRKSFKTVSAFTVSGSTAGLVSCGPGDTFGMPYCSTGRYAVLTSWNNAQVTTGTFTGGSTATATATTGDVRGTYLVPDASDGSKKLVVWMYLEDVETSTGLYGVAQYGG